MIKCLLPFTDCVPIETAVAHSAFASSRYPQAGTKNFRYLSFPYSNPLSARREARAAEPTGNPLLAAVSPVQGQRVKIWRREGQEAQSVLLSRNLNEKKKMKASSPNKFWDFIYGHRDLNSSQFCHALLSCFNLGSSND